MLRIHWRFRFVKTIFCIFLKVFTLITKVGIFFSHLQFMMLLHFVWMCLSVCVFVDKTNQRTRSLTLFCQDFVLVYRRICLEWIQSGCLDMAVCGCETVVKAVSCLSAAFLPSIHIFFHNPSPPFPRHQIIILPITVNRQNIPLSSSTYMARDTKYGRDVALALPFWDIRLR